MPAATNSRLVAGSTGVRDAYGWREKAATVLVEGLSRTVTKDDLVFDAYTQMAADGFDYGDPHPEDAALKIFGDMSFTVMSTSAVEIGVTYRRPEPGDDPTYVAVRGDMVLVQERTNKDKNNADLVTEWKPDATRTAKTQTGMVDVWRPSHTMEFSKPLSVCPITIAKTIIGFTNSDTFQGDAAGFWLCMGCGYASPDGGTTWETAFRFARNARLWKQTIYYILDNGKPPANYDAGYQNGKCLQEIEVYDSVAFAALGLPDMTAS